MAPVYMFTSVQVFATVFPLSGQQPKSRVVKMVLVTNEAIEFDPKTRPVFLVAILA